MHRLDGPCLVRLVIRMRDHILFDDRRPPAHRSSASAPRAPMTRRTMARPCIHSQLCRPQRMPYPYVTQIRQARCRKRTASTSRGCLSHLPSPVSTCSRKARPISRAFLRRFCTRATRRDSYHLGQLPRARPGISRAADCLWHCIFAVLLLAFPPLSTEANNAAQQW